MRQQRRERTHIGRMDILFLFGFAVCIPSLSMLTYTNESMCLCACAYAYAKQWSQLLSIGRHFNNHVMLVRIFSQTQTPATERSHSFSLRTPLLCSTFARCIRVFVCVWVYSNTHAIWNTFMNNPMHAATLAMACRHRHSFEYVCRLSLSSSSWILILGVRASVPTVALEYGMRTYDWDPIHLWIYCDAVSEMVRCRRASSGSFNAIPFDRLLLLCRCIDLLDVLPDCPSKG